MSSPASKCEPGVICNPPCPRKAAFSPAKKITLLGGKSPAERQKFQSFFVLWERGLFVPLVRAGLTT